MVYYYAVVDGNYIVTDVVELEEQVGEPNWLPITSYNQDLVGMWYDIEDQTFKLEGYKYLNKLVQVDGADSGLDADKLDGKDASQFALAGHTHEGMGECQCADCLPLTGGSVTGDVSITGDLDVSGEIDCNLIRTNGQQSLFNSGVNLIIGTNNLPTIIACKADADVTINGTNLGCGNIHPRANASHGIGISSKRWNDVFLINSPNVSSDSRLKENVVSVDDSEMLDFINALRVVNYNFISDEAKRERIGLIAQEVELAGGNKFVEIGDDGMYGLRGADLVYPLIAAVKALSKRVAELESKE